MNTKQAYRQHSKGDPSAETEIVMAVVIGVLFLGLMPVISWLI